jgi:DNA-entry nuclease
VILLACAFYAYRELEGTVSAQPTVSLAELPAYDGTPYVELNGNVPAFDESDFTTNSFETYSPLDALGRCGAAYANIGRDLMPTEKRGNISSVKPSGWVQAQYDFVDGKALYNRCHLIGYQLTGENANEGNLITGTRYLNVEGMLPFENMVTDYIKETGNHVLYRVTPVYDGSDLVAQGVQMEAESVEDRGDGICYNVFCYNVQPGVTIDYATGESALAP